MGTGDAGEPPEVVEARAESIARTAARVSNVALDRAGAMAPRLKALRDLIIKRLKSRFSKMKETDDVAKAIRDVQEKVQPDIDKEDESFNTLDKEAEGNSASKNPKDNWSSRLKYTFYILCVLSLLAGTILGYVLLLQYCANHSGCIQIQLIKGQDKEQQTKVWCSGSDIKGTKNRTYSINQCQCVGVGKQSTDQPHKSPCESCKGSGGDTDDNNFPSPTKNGPCVVYDTNGNNVCGLGKVLLSNTCTNAAVCDMSETFGTNLNDGYMYYSYQVMTPFDGVLDIVKKVLNMFKPPKWLITIIIIACVIIGVIVVIYLGTKIFAAYEAGKGTSITVQAPAKFGNYSGNYLGNYLGNLNNYAYMGLCDVYPT